MPIYLKIQVSASAKREIVRKDAKGRLIMSTKEPAKGGRANRRVIEILRELYPEQPIRIVSGHHSPSKMVLIGRE